MTQTRGKLRIAALVLAAGAATRMGRLKQLLPYRGQPLLMHCIQQAVIAGFEPVVVVVGAEAETVIAALAPEPVTIVRNDAWASGMGSSIAAGMRLIGNSPDAVAILLADQPLVTGAHLTGLTSVLQTSGSPIAAAEYAGTLGVPALFKREMFPLLATLPPEAGARHLLRAGRSQISAFPLPEAAADIDTPEDFAALHR